LLNVHVVRLQHAQAELDDLHRGEHHPANFVPSHIFGAQAHDVEHVALDARAEQKQEAANCIFLDVSVVVLLLPRRLAQLHGVLVLSEIVEADENWHVGLQRLGRLQPVFVVCVQGFALVHGHERVEVELFENGAQRFNPSCFLAGNLQLLIAWIFVFVLKHLHNLLVGG